MCIAVPMEVITLLGAGTAQVALSGNLLTVDISLVDVQPGDFVLVHAGCALQVVQADTAREIQELLAELEELATHDADS